jgi:broad specificity phosphatase PhoE
VESTNNVANRTKLLVDELERTHRRCVVVLTSHGDTLQILQTVFAGIDPSLQRSVPHLNLCELRRLEKKDLTDGAHQQQQRQQH